MPYFVKLFFAIFLIMSLSSCGSDDGTTTDENTTTSETEEDDSTIGEIIGDTIGEVIDDSLGNETTDSSEDAFDELEDETGDGTSTSGTEEDDKTTGEIIGDGIGDIIDNIIDDNMTEEADDTVGEPIEDLVDGNSSIAPEIEEPVVEEPIDDGFIPVDEVELKAIIDDFNQTIGFYDTGSELSWYYNGLSTYAGSEESCENRGERLPTISELVRIIDPLTEKGVPEFLEDEEYFDVGAVIWSSTLDPVYGVEGQENGIPAGSHLSGTIYYGVDIFNDKLNDEEHYSFCVSGTNKKLGIDISERDVSRTDDGVVVDNTFRLVWEDTDSVLVQLNYEEAEMHCANLDLDGKDWRLPTFRELFSIVDHSKQNQTVIETADATAIGAPGFAEVLDKPAKIYGHFQNIPEVTDGDLLNYWTSTEKFGEDRAWTVKFADGRNNYPLLSDSAYIRCVADLNSEREFLPTAGTEVTGEDTPELPTLPINN
ncbi:Protein of unknown function (DUF1566) [Thiovulum sp. ES]|nr:Protein of unknown function (DUF1566) [Thiovulum sp. ES]